MYKDCSQFRIHAIDGACGMCLSKKVGCSLARKGVMMVPLVLPRERPRWVSADAISYQEHTSLSRRPMYGDV